MYLTANVSLTISGEDADMFETSRSSLTIADANSSITQNNVTLSYVPTEEGQHSGILTIASEGAETITVKLYGACNAACEVTWMVDGEEYTLGNPTTSLAAGSKITQLPTAPASPFAESNQFVGWSEEVITSPRNEVPTDLFSDVSDAPTVSHDVVYNAVFATLEEIEVEEPSATSVSMNLNNTDGWTLSGLIRDSKHWRVVKNAYIESPQINLANVTSIVVNLRTYGGSSYKTLSFSMNGTKVGEINATTNKLKDYTWTPSSPLSGTGKLNFYSTTSTAENGPALSSIYIAMEGGGVTTEYSYSNYITTSKGAITEVDVVMPETKMASKIIRNGQLVIEYNGVYYNTMGQVVEM
jgi:hypothetical protein